MAHRQSSALNDYTENLDDDADINRASETVTENIKISTKENLGFYELKQHKLLFDEGC
jgi:hypothetical protein